MRKFIYPLLIVAATAVTIISCKKSSSDNASGTDKSGFDRKPMLTNWENNIILPAYTAYQADVTALDAAVSAYVAAPDAGKLTALQTAFKTTYKQWQATSAFDFGPALDVNLRANTNTYPLDLNQVNSNITSGTYNPGLLANLSAKGLPALDYLLFGVGADNAAILAQYTSDANAAKRKTYLTALSAELKTNATSVLNAWNGTYKTTFVNAAGIDAGSSTAILVNQLIFDYEILKNYEIGIPAGIQSLGTTYPNKVQAYYSKMSVQLALLHIKALQDIYTGKDGVGLDDYLVKVNAKSKDGQALDPLIKSLFASATSQLQGLTDPLSANIINNNTQVTTAYAELQKLVPPLKTDMTSSLAILISFGDNDGD